MSKKVNLAVMKLGKYAHLIVLNDHLVHGEFPNSATTILEQSIPMEKIADAFSVNELEAMLAYRKGEAKSIEEPASSNGHLMFSPEEDDYK